MVNQGEEILTSRNEINDSIFEEEASLYTLNIDQLFLWLGSYSGQNWQSSLVGIRKGLWIVLFRRYY